MIASDYRYRFSTVSNVRDYCICRLCHQFGSTPKARPSAPPGSGERGTLRRSRLQKSYRRQHPRTGHGNRDTARKQRSAVATENLTPGGACGGRRPGMQSKDELNMLIDWETAHPTLVTGPLPIRSGPGGLPGPGQRAYWRRQTDFGKALAVRRIICGAVQQPPQSSVFPARAVCAQKVVRGGICRARHQMRD